MIIHFLEDTHIFFKDGAGTAGRIDLRLTAEGVVDLRTKHHITYAALTGNIVTEIQRQLGIIEFRHVTALTEDVLQVKRCTVVRVGHGMLFAHFRIGESIEECRRVPGKQFRLNRCRYPLDTDADTGLQEEVAGVELI